MDALMKVTDSVTGLAIPLKDYFGSIRVANTVGPQGDFPDNIYTPIAVTTTVAAVITLTGLHGMHSGQIRITGLTLGETIDISLLSDAGTTMGNTLVKRIDTAIIAAEIQSTALGIGSYLFSNKLTCAGIVFTKSAAVGSVTLAGFLSGAS